MVRLTSCFRTQETPPVLTFSSRRGQFNFLGTNWTPSRSWHPYQSTIINSSLSILRNISCSGVCLFTYIAYEDEWSPGPGAESRQSYLAKQSETNKASAVERSSWNFENPAPQRVLHSHWSTSVDIDLCKLSLYVIYCKARNIPFSQHNTVWS